MVLNSSAMENISGAALSRTAAGMPGGSPLRREGPSFLSKLWAFLNTPVGHTVFLTICSVIATKYIMKSLSPAEKEAAASGALVGSLSTINFEDVIGGVPEQISKVADMLTDMGKYQRLGARLPKGFLFTGPPGVGKTHLARAIAGEIDAPFFSVNGTQLLSKWVGIGPQMIRSLFQEARRAAANSDSHTAIILIDEIDSIGQSRSLGDSTRTASILSALLSEMDGFSRNLVRLTNRSVFPWRTTHTSLKVNIVVIATTNAPRLLDPALTRAGRFDYCIEVSLPDQEKRKAVLLNLLKRHPIYLPEISSPEDDDIEEVFNLDTIAAGTHRWNCADLDLLVNQAAVLAADAGSEGIQPSHMKISHCRLALQRSRRRFAYSLI